MSRFLGSTSLVLSVGFDHAALWDMEERRRIGPAWNLGVTANALNIGAGGWFAALAGPSNVVSLNTASLLPPQNFGEPVTGQTDVHAAQLFAEICSILKVERNGTTRMLTPEEWHERWQRFRAIHDAAPPGESER